MSREQFIGRMVQHILPKGFKRIRYYGLQATCKLRKVGAILKQAFKQAVQGVLGFVSQMSQRAVVKLSYQERMKRAYGRDPLRCEQCGAEMWLWQVWHPEYGLIYDEGEAIKAGKYEPPPKDGLPDPGTEPEPLSQLSLFDLQASLGYG